MHRLYPILLICMLLLAACGVATPPTVVPTEPTAPAHAPLSLVSSGAYATELTRQTLLPDSSGQGQIGTPGRAVTGAGGASPGLVSMRQNTPPLEPPKLHVHLPPVTPGARGMSLHRLAPADDWTILLDEDFHDPDPDIWGTGQEIEGGRTDLTGGQLRITANPGWIVAITPRPAMTLTDGLIATAFTLEGSGTAGVMVRAGSDSGGNTMYICGANNGGGFFCYRRTDGKWSVVTSGTNDAIQPGAPIVLALQAVRDQFKLTINGVEVASFSDDVLQSGAWRLFAQSDAEETTATFSEVQISVPAVGAATATPTVRPGRPTRTPTPTVRPDRPTATLPPAAGEQGGDQVVVDANFANGDAGTWRTGSSDHSSVAVHDGALVLSVDQPGLLLISYPAEATDLADANIETTLRLAGQTGRAGVFARFQRAADAAWSMYFCWIDKAGRWACGTDVHDRATLLGSGTLASIKPDANNRLSLSISGGTISFQVNDVPALNFNDVTLARGTWGVWATAGDGPTAAYFDQVTITRLGAGAAPTVAPPVQPTAEPTAGTSGPVRGKVGERVVSGGMALTVLTVANEAGYYRDILHLGPDQKYIDVDVVLENVNRGGVFYDSAFFKLKDPDGFEYRKYPTDYTLPAFGFGTMVAGEKARGHMNWIVPKSVSGWNLVCDMAHISDLRTIYIDLGQ